MKLYQQLQADRRAQRSDKPIEQTSTTRSAPIHQPKHEQERIQKIIASAGICSRRQAEKLIILGKVSVNGQIVTALGAKADPAQDIISVDGQLIHAQDANKVYFVLNKPRGFICTTSDPQGRATVMDLMSGISERIYPVGRLDFASEGLLIFTNDGEVANQLMHPRFGVTRTYAVKVRGHLPNEILETLRAGVRLAEGFVKPVRVWRGSALENKEWIHIELQEGKNHEIRRIFSSLGLEVDRLRRVAIGSLTIQGIPVGKYRKLSKRDIDSILQFAKTDGNIPKQSSKRKIRPHQRSRGI